MTVLSLIDQHGGLHILQVLALGRRERRQKTTELVGIRQFGKNRAAGDGMHYNLAGSEIMRYWWSFFVIVCSVCPISRAQVVQLPTFSQFQVRTTVSVPDRGAAYLGGVRRSRSGSTSRSVPGLGRLPVAGRAFQNRDFGFDRGQSQSSIRATILDLNEMDRRVLAEGRMHRGKTVAVDPVEDRARFLSRHVGRASRNPHLKKAAAQMVRRQTPRPDRLDNANTRRAAKSAKTPEPPLILKRRR